MKRIFVVFGLLLATGVFAQTANDSITLDPQNN